MRNKNGLRKSREMVEEGLGLGRKVRVMITLFLNKSWINPTFPLWVPRTCLNVLLHFLLY